MHHFDDTTLTPADHGVMLHDDALGRIVQNGDDFDAWEWQGEYLGGFASHERAYIELIEAQSVHQSLVNAYHNR